MGEAPYDDGVTPREENNLKTRPDGDVELDGEAVVDFIVPPCRECGGGPLKPAVVFFGDSVPRDVALAAKGASEECDGVLVVGSSVSTFVRVPAREGRAREGSAGGGFNVRVDARGRDGVAQGGEAGGGGAAAGGGATRERGYVGVLMKQF